MQGQDYANVIKVLPKYYPLAKTRNPSINKSLSPLRGLKTKLQSDDPINNYNITASVENNKLENLENFFVEKFRKVSKKVEIGLKETRNETSTEKTEKLTTYASVIEERPAHVSRVKKDLMKTEEEVQVLLDDEEKKLNYKEKPFFIDFSKNESDKGRPYLQKFAVLSKKATKILSSVDSQGKFNIEKLSMPKDEVKFPLLKQNKFFDPTPLPPTFQVNKDLIIPEY